MYQFHARFLARPAGVGPADTVRLGAREVAPLAAWAVPEPFPVSFEEASDALGRLSRMFVEPDGAWVWAGDGWQLDGVLVDRGGRLLHVEAKGSCPAAELDRLLGCFGWPAAELAFELVREGARLGEGEFRAFARNSV